ncbi:hypothetical protein [uncultured Amaricoccus sp.]|uniref:hypothetical protein n=1 Tax=uncultured Amaricoccus sp. TaxID=339341 RepID=UPI002608B01B|nr:hypothetical protein [uncultured Amaricoccus sp.]
MTAYRITPATSVYTDVFRAHAFAADSAGPDSLTVDAGAFLVANRLGIGAYLGGTGAWTVSVAGSVVSTYEEGILLAPGADGSRVTIGAEGSVSGKMGITLVSAATVENAGSIVGTTFYGIQVDKGATHTIVNSGTIEAPIAIGDSLGLAADTVTNTGTLTGGVFLSGGTDTLTNGGAITGDVGLGDGADVLTNFVTRAGVTVSGGIAGLIDLGAGNDRFAGGTGAERVQDGDGADSVALGDGGDRYIATGNGGGDGADTVAGGGGVDTYDASASTVAVAVNLDSVAHGLGPVSTSGGNMAAQTATGATVAGASLDRITGFENATGGAAGDRLHGSGVANVLKGNGGTDMLFGYGGDDTLSGGASFDNLVGGAGRDVLTGGSEADSFDFAARTDSGVTAATRDVITDFEDFVDVINLAPMDADSTRAGNDAFRFIGMHTAFTGHAGELRAVFSGAGEVVEADTNGDGIADFSVALRDSAHSIVLSAADFIL